MIRAKSMRLSLVILLLLTGCAGALRNSTLSGTCERAHWQDCSDRYAQGSRAREVCEQEAAKTYARATKP